MLELRNVSKRYSGIPALEAASFTANKGEVTGYLGANGSGKSTTMKIVSGLLKPTSGDILFEGSTPARFLALDLNIQKFAWDIRTRVPQSSAILTTAGGLVFSATLDRYFRAFDDRDGKVLWQSPRLNDIPNAFPITYMVDGKQYIAMPVRNPGLHGSTALNTAPENAAVRGSKPAVLWVWELP